MKTITISAFILGVGSYVLGQGGKLNPQTVTIGQFTVSSQGNIGSVAIPDAASKLSYHIDSTQNLNPGVVLTVGSRISINGGPFQDLESGTRTGGAAFDDFGNPVNSFDVTVSLPPGINRQLQMFIKTQNGSFVSAGGSVPLS